MLYGNTEGRPAQKWPHFLPRSTLRRNCRRSRQLRRAFKGGGLRCVMLFAIAGGAGPGDEEVLSCCGVCPILPLVFLLAGLAVFRNSIWAGCLALLMAGLPYVVLRSMVTGYEPSTDGDVVADQAAGRKAVGLYAVMSAVAGLSVVWVVARRLAWRRSKGAEPGAAQLPMNTKPNENRGEQSGEADSPRE